MSINDTCIKYLRVILYMTWCDNLSLGKKKFYSPHIFFWQHQKIIIFLRFEEMFISLQNTIWLQNNY